MPGGPKFAKYIKQVRTLGDSQLKKIKIKNCPHSHIWLKVDTCLNYSTGLPV